MAEKDAEYLRTNTKHGKRKVRKIRTEANREPRSKARAKEGKHRSSEDD